MKDSTPWLTWLGACSAAAMLTAAGSQAGSLDRWAAAVPMPADAQTVVVGSSLSRFGIGDDPERSLAVVAKANATEGELLALAERALAMGTRRILVEIHPIATHPGWRRGRDVDRGWRGLSRRLWVATTGATGVFLSDPDCDGFARPLPSDDMERQRTIGLRSPRHLEAWKVFAHHAKDAGMSVALFALPQSQDSLPPDGEEVAHQLPAHLLGTARSVGLPLLEAPLVLPDHMFCDGRHLNREGRRHLRDHVRWLGKTDP